MMNSVFEARLPALIKYISVDMNGYLIQKRNGLPTQTFHHRFLCSKDSKFIQKKSLELANKIANGENVNLYEYMYQLEKFFWERAILAHDCFYYDEREVDIRIKNEVLLVILKAFEILKKMNKEV